MDIPVAAHFLYPQHELKLRQYHPQHTCDLCGENVTGSGYSCHRRLCGFNLHEECARFPETLRSCSAHPWHDLTLSRTATDDDDDGQRRRSTTYYCVLCREDVVHDGVFLYRCAPCGFAVHPRCSRLPQTARSELHHPDHDLVLTPLTAGTSSSSCAVCREPGGFWVYRCGLCVVDLHVEYLHGARGGKKKDGKGGPFSLDQVLLGTEILSNVTEPAGNIFSLATNP